MGKDRRWLVLAEDGRHSIIGIRTDPSPEEIRALGESLESAGLAAWLAVWGAGVALAADDLRLVVQADPNALDYDQATSVSSDGEYVVAVGAGSGILVIWNLDRGTIIDTMALPAGDPAGAIARYREALRLSPDYPEAHQNLAAALQAVGRSGESVAECRQLVRLRPDNPESHFNLGVALQLDGRTAEAIGAFEQALRMKPDYPDAENNLGLSLAGIGRTPEAVVHFGNAVRLRPDSADLRLNLGSALYNSGDIPAAVAQLTQAVSLDPGLAAAHYSLGVALRKMGSAAEAAAEIHRAGELGLRQ